MEGRWGTDGILPAAAGERGEGEEVLRFKGRRAQGIRFCTSGKYTDDLSGCVLKVLTDMEERKKCQDCLSVVCAS